LQAAEFPATKPDLRTTVLAAVAAVVDTAAVAVAAATVVAAAVAATVVVAADAAMVAEAEAVVVVAAVDVDLIAITKPISRSSINSNKKAEADAPAFFVYQDLLLVSNTRTVLNGMPVIRLLEHLKNPTEAFDPIP
jgi:hypothetical protein